MNIPTIAMIGAGNMGASLIGGIIKSGHPPEKIFACDHEAEKLKALQLKFRIATGTNAEAAEIADILIFAVKPQSFAAAAKELAPLIQAKKPLIISIAAGVRAQSIQSWVGEKIGIIRAMPNTPALIGHGASALYANPNVTEHQKKLAEKILSAVGLAVWVDSEEHMDTVTALSGSGPAYFFLMMEALQNAAEQLGLSADTAKQLTLQTALGAAQMAMQSGKSLEELRRSVTSPGGTTEKAISVLEEHNIRDIFSKAVKSAKLRSHELAEMVDQGH